jgi:hypothetical protein
MAIARAPSGSEAKKFYDMVWEQYLAGNLTLVQRRNGSDTEYLVIRVGKRKDFAHRWLRPRRE